MSKISVAASEDEPVVPQFEIGGLLLPQVEPIAYGRKPDIRARRRRCNRASVQMLDGADHHLRRRKSPRYSNGLEENSLRSLNREFSEA